MTGMLGNHPRRHWQGGCGGGCCNTAADDRHAKKAIKQVEKLELRQTILEETSPDDAFDVIEIDPHIYEGERCIYCGVNMYDNHLLGPFACTRQEPLNHTTETP